MKYLLMTLLMCVLAFILVSAVPVDESIAGDLYGSEQSGPEDPNSIFKLKKIKKLLFG